MTLRYAPFRFQLILLIALAFHTLASAQPLHIAKDNFACLYGLKNAKGEWVVPAGYTGISNTTNGYFITQADRDLGLIDSTGKIVFSPRYTEITSHPQDWNDNYYYNYSVPRQPRKVELLIVSTQKRRAFTGVIDLSGKIILPVIYSAIAPSGDLLIANDSLGQTQCFDKTGKPLTKKYTYIIPTPDEQSFICGNGQQWASGSICGVLNLQGDTSIPFRYASISYANGSFICMTKDTSYTLLDRSGKKLVPGSYKLIIDRDHYFMAIRNDSSFFFNETGELQLSISGYIEQWHARWYYDYSSDHPDFTDRALYKAYMPGKGYMLMNRNGTAITPPYYDAINLLPVYQRDNSHYLWTFLKNKKMGVLDTSGQVCIPAIYDSIIFLAGQGNEPPCVVLRNNHHYGLYDDSTKKSSAFVYDDYSVLDFGYRRVIFFAGKTSWCLYDAQSGKVISTDHIRTLNKFPDGSILCALDTYCLFVLEQKPGQLWTVQPCPYYRSQQYFIQHIGDSDYLISREGKIYAGPVQEIITDLRDQLILISKKGRASVADPNTGRVRPDSSYFALAPGIPHPLYHWVKPKRTAACKLAQQPEFVERLQAPARIYGSGMVYLWSTNGAKSPPPPPPSTCDCGWALADSTGKLITPAQFGKPFSLEKKIQVAYGNNGAGLFDGRTMKFVTPPVYYTIDKFAERYFSVMTFSGKFGIMDSTGHLLADTTWEAATLAFDGDLKHIGKQSADTSKKSPYAYYYGEPAFAGAFRDNRAQHFRDTEHYPAFWLFEKPGATAIFTENGKLISAKKTVDEFMRWSLCPQAWNDSICSNSEIYLPAHRDSNWTSAARDLIAKRLAEKKPGYQQYAFHTSIGYVSYGYPGQDSHRQFSTLQDYSPLTKTTQQWYELAYAKKTCCAVKHHFLVEQRGYDDIGPASLQTYTENYRRDGDRLVPLHFSDLVQGDTAAIFQSLLADALRQHDEVTMSCMQAEKLFETGKSNHSLSDAGIVFTYSIYMNYAQVSLDLLVPWKALLPYTKENGIVAECAKPD